MDFLLSLSVKAKEKLAKASLPQNANKSVMYADQTLSEADVSISFSVHLILRKFTRHF
jgi:THO complex subunit 1